MTYDIEGRAQRRAKNPRIAQIEADRADRAARYKITLSEGTPTTPGPRCGTVNQLEHHLTHGEECRKCNMAEAKRERRRQARAMARGDKRQTDPIKHITGWRKSCGTSQGRTDHEKNNEKPCRKCNKATSGRK